MFISFSPKDKHVALLLDSPFPLCRTADDVMRREAGLEPSSTSLITPTHGHTSLPSLLSSVICYITMLSRFCWGYAMFTSLCSGTCFSPPSQVVYYDYIAFLANTVFRGINHYFVVFFCLVFRTNLLPKPPPISFPIVFYFILFIHFIALETSLSELPDLLPVDHYSLGPNGGWANASPYTPLLAIFFTSGSWTPHPPSDTHTQTHTYFFFLDLLSLHSFLMQNFQQFHEKGWNKIL